MKVDVAFLSSIYTHTKSTGIQVPSPNELASSINSLEQDW